MLDAAGIAQDISRLGVARDGITAGEDLLGTEQAQLGFERADAFVPGA